jgi:hypothetical protein
LLPEQLQTQLLAKPCALVLVLDMELADGTLEDWQSISQSFLVPSAGLVHAVNGWMDGWMDGWMGGWFCVP